MAFRFADPAVSGLVGQGLKTLTASPEASREGWEMKKEAKHGQEQLRELQELVSEMFEIFDEDSYGCDCGTNELGTCFFCRGQKVNNEFKDFIKTNALTASPASCHCSGPSPCIHEVKAPASKEASQEGKKP